MSPHDALARIHHRLIAMDEQQLRMGCQPVSAPIDPEFRATEIRLVVEGVAAGRVPVAALEIAGAQLVSWMVQAAEGETCRVDAEVKPVDGRWLWRVYDPDGSGSAKRPEQAAPGVIIDGTPWDGGTIAHGHAGSRAHAERRATKAAQREWQRRQWQKRAEAEERRPLKWEVWSP